MGVAAILFLMDSSQKLIRSSKIPREQWTQSNQRFTSDGAHKLPKAAILENGRLWLDAKKKYMGWIAQAHRSCL